MPIYKRGKNYWIDISAPDGTRVRRSTGTEEKEKAQQYHDKIKHELWDVHKLDKKEEHLFEEIVILAMKDAEGQALYDTKKGYARYWLSVFKGRSILSIKGDEIARNMPTHSQHKSRKRLENGTINRYRAFIVRAFSLALKHGWIENRPYIPELREPKVRVKWMRKWQARELIDALETDIMRRVVSFALLTGARRGEILSLTWENVDIENRNAIVTAENAKSGRARALPLNDEAIRILRESDMSCEYVFSVDGERLSDIDRVDFFRATQKARISDFRFHDLRHTWASWHVQNGTPLMMLKEMGGWETLEMVKKYAHLSAEHLNRFVGSVTFLTQENELDARRGLRSVASL
ncbi:MAG: site-specific integrase [Pluralibacter sp.]|nr:site-specific integrase [Pluralibacter sp.]MBV8045135.1 site-specific integrase [Pluralibacter sp.]